MPFPIAAALPIVGKVIDRVLPDKAAKDAAKLALLWLSNNGEFYRYAGGIPQALQSTVRRDVFDNMSKVQGDKIFAFCVAAYNEVWWLYPDGRDGIECSRYVAYNFVENTWTSGTFDRTAWCDAGVLRFPMAADISGKVYFQEKGYSADGGALEWHLESGLTDLGKGGEHKKVQAIIPDFEDLQGGVSLYLKHRNYPGSSLTESGPYDITSNTTPQQQTASVIGALESDIFPMGGEAVGPESSSQTGAVRGREFIPARLATGLLPPTDDFLIQQQLSPELTNVLSRFSLMQRLLSEGLVTQSEVDDRRDTNLGALLPYTYPAPAAGLTRSVPSADAVSSRLQALKRSLEMRAITPRQHSIERGMILDAILPARALALAPSEPFPTNILDAARRVGALEQMRANGVISQVEFDRERASIDSFLMSGQIPDDAAIDAAIDTAMNSPELEAASAPQMPSSNVAVHLASYRSRQAAESGWNQLQTKFSSQLGGLNSVVRSVNLGGQRGTFFRLMAGPIQTQARAQEICQQLKRADQYCDTLTLDS